MSVFGVTGSLASGKSLVLKLLKKRGVSVFDADRLIHAYYRDRKSGVYKKVAALFPEALRGERICRKRLATAVLGESKRLRKLEGAVHPQIIRDLKSWIRRTEKGKIYAAEVPLLFEKNLSVLFDGVILIYAKRKRLLARIGKKFKISQSQARKRLALNLSMRKKIERSDFIINNNVPLKKLKVQVDALLRELKRRSKR